MSDPKVSASVFVFAAEQIIEVTSNDHLHPGQCCLSIELGDDANAAQVHLCLAAAERLRDLLGSTIQDYRTSQDLDDPPAAEDSPECDCCGKAVDANGLVDGCCLGCRTPGGDPVAAGRYRMRRIMGGD